MQHLRRARRQQHVVHPWLEFSYDSSLHADPRCCTRSQARQGNFGDLLLALFYLLGTGIATLVLEMNSELGPFLPHIQVSAPPSLGVRVGTDATAHWQAMLENFHPPLKVCLLDVERREIQAVAAVHALVCAIPVWISVRKLRGPNGNSEHALDFGRRHQFARIDSDWSPGDR